VEHPVVGTYVDDRRPGLDGGPIASSVLLLKGLVSWVTVDIIIVLHRPGDHRRGGVDDVAQAPGPLLVRRGITVRVEKHAPRPHARHILPDDVSHQVLCLCRTRLPQVVLERVGVARVEGDEAALVQAREDLARFGHEIAEGQFFACLPHGPQVVHGDVGLIPRTVPVRIGQ